MAITDTREEIIQKRHYRPNIKGDQYSLYLSNYPISVQYLANRIGDKDKILLELCCGVGVTLSEMASRFKKVIGVELDKEILEYCKENLAELGVIEKSEIILGDINDTNLINKLEADIAIYDIPYWVAKELSDGTNVLDKNPDFNSITKNILNNITSDLVVFAPNYFELENIEKITENYEFQRVYINEKYDRNYIYFGNLVKNKGISEIRLNL